MSATAIYILLFITGAGAGAGGYALLDSGESVERDSQTERNLSEPDLVFEASKIDKLTFREALCRTQATEKNASQDECETISNVQNSIEIDRYCTNHSEPEKCFRFFRERK